MTGRSSEREGSGDGEIECGERTRTCPAHPFALWRVHGQKVRRRHAWHERFQRGRSIPESAERIYGCDGDAMPCEISHHVCTGESPSEGACFKVGGLPTLCSRDVPVVRLSCHILVPCPPSERRIAAHSAAWRSARAPFWRPRDAPLPPSFPLRPVLSPPHSERESSRRRWPQPSSPPPPPPPPTPSPAPPSAPPPSADEVTAAAKLKPASPHLSPSNPTTG